MVHVLSDIDLIRKLLAMKIKATTAEMLNVCHTHITIADNISSIGLSNKAVNTEGDEEINNTWQLMWQLHKMPHSRERTLLSKGLYLPFLPEDWSLEAKV